MHIPGHPMKTMNLNALEFYDKMGFSEGVQYRYALKDEVRERLLWNKKNLARRFMMERRITDCFFMERNCGI